MLVGTGIYKSGRYYFTGKTSVKRLSRFARLSGGSLTSNTYRKTRMNNKGVLTRRIRHIYIYTSYTRYRRLSVCRKPMFSSSGKHSRFAARDRIHKPPNKQQHNNNNNNLRTQSYGARTTFKHTPTTYTLKMFTDETNCTSFQ